MSRPNGRLQIEDVPLEQLASGFGTPLYVYSRAAIESAWAEFAAAIEERDALVCYAIKANSSLAILDLLARKGAGFDIVSAGELQRVLAAGGRAEQTVFSGVGKSEAEMLFALRAGVRCFNVESLPELDRLNAVAARAGRPAPVSLRVNPDIDAGTHPYISTGLRENKFGIAHDDAVQAYQRAAALPHLRIEGIDCHIGSQITELAPFLAALDRVLELVDHLARLGIDLKHLDLGGGLGVRYDQESPPARRQLLGALFDRVEHWAHARHRPVPSVLFEFGRSLVGEAGLLLTRVEYLKHTQAKHFAVVDAAMNDLLRPTLYEAYHPIEPVLLRPESPLNYDVVGPVCESGDWLGRNRMLALHEGDLLAILVAGAYGMSMSSNYNSRPRAAEVMVSGSQVHLIRPRETLESLYAGETILPQTD